jgi:hypothetical protein
MSLARQFDAYRAWRDDVRRLAEHLQVWLAEGDFLDTETDQRLRRIRERLDEDKLVVAFVAEFSRGKSELINALFFADRGGRVLPSSAGRTTMCPTEISWDRSLAPRIALLPIETRGEGVGIADLRGVPEAWQAFPFDPESPDDVAESLRRVGEVKQVPVATARALGFAIGNGADGSLVSDKQGQVEIPRWRHAMINFPHPLLEQGLVVLDTPGLNAIGAEPELTLSLLPSAHAVLFILAADTGVTQTDLAVWRDHVGSGVGRLVVLNKIDGLWDGLRPSEDIDAEIDRQVDSCAHILGIQPSNVFPVSAQKGLVAKIGRDALLLERSRLPELEDALAEGLLPAKQEIVARSTAGEARQLAGEMEHLLATRRAAMASQRDELAALRGKNASMVAQMVAKAKMEKELYEKGLREYYAVRSVYTRLSETLFSHLGLEALRSHARRTRETMRQAYFTPQLLAAMGELFAAAGECLDSSESDIAEISTMMKVMRDKFGKAYGVAIEPPISYSLTPRRRQLNHLEVASRRQYANVMKLLMSDKQTLTQQFFETVVSQIRRIFDHANRDAEQWLRALMAPLENQVREVQRQMRHRLDNVRRIHEAAEGLEDRIAELSQEIALLDSRLVDLAEVAAALDVTLRPPKAAGKMRVAA